MITTWLTDNDLKEYSQVKDKELNELFQEIRQITNNKFYIQETSWKDNPPFWRKAKPSIAYYTLYAVAGWDAQVINFPQNHSWSINTGVTKAFIMTFFYGLLSGRRYPEPLTEKA